jgi:hypothetical protein
MAPHDPLAYLQAILAKDFEAHRYKVAKGKPLEQRPLVITISRDYGALGEEIAKELSACLGIPVYDQEILNRVAKQAKTDKFLVQHHDEQSHAGMSTFVHSLISGGTATLQSYRRSLYDVVLELARHGCIIVGRGAHLILKDKHAFRVRIVGSTAICAGRIASELGISLQNAEAKVQEINVTRHKSIQALYGEHFPSGTLEHAAHFDLIVNTDRIDAQGAVLVIVMGLEQAGFDLHSTVKA